MSNKLVNLHFAISEHLEKIEKMFVPPVKVTLVVRTPAILDGGVMIGNDEHEAVIAEIMRLKDRKPVVERG